MSDKKVEAAWNEVQMSQNPVILETDGNDLTGGVQAGIKQAYVGQRTTRQDGKTKLEQLNAIKIVSGRFICQARRKTHIFV